MSKPWFKRAGFAVIAALSITGAPVTTATKDLPYAGFSAVGHNGRPPYTYALQTGTLPAGLALNTSSGAVSGTPTGIETQTGLVIRVTDALGSVADLASFQIAVAAYSFTNSEATTVFNKMIANGAADPGSVISQAMDTLVGALKSASIWSACDRLYVPAIHDALAGPINWITPGTGDATPTTSPTFVQYKGYKGNASSSYVDTNFNPGDGGTYAYKQNDAHAAVWVTDTVTDAASATKCSLGIPSTVTTFLRPWSAVAAPAYRLNAATTQSVGVVTTRKGLRSLNRASSSQSLIYINGANPVTTSQVSTALQNATLRLLGTTGLFSDDTVGFASFGSTLNATQHGQLYTAVFNFLHVLGTV